MCGIFCVISADKTINVAQYLLAGLKLLEYRGYDSAGIGLLNLSKQKHSLEQKQIDLDCLKAVGEIDSLKQAYEAMPISGYAGVAHTRWATHGAVSIRNTHPVVVGEVGLVFNGVVENYFDLRQELHEKYGYIASTETDTETITALVHYFFLETQDLAEAVKRTCKKLVGKIAFVAISSFNPESLVCASLGRTLVIGQGENKNFIASDMIAFPSEVHSTIHLENDDVAVVQGNLLQIDNLNGRAVNRETEPYHYEEYKLSRDKHKTFMHKEIYEQPSVIDSILSSIQIDIEKNSSTSSILSSIEKINLQQFKRVHIIACGAAYYAGYVGKYLIERECQIVCSIDIASEFCVRKPVIDNETLYLFISQSGETADTISAMEYVKKSNARTLCIVNKMQSPIAKRCDVVIPLCAGLEQSVAATKTFTTQILILILITQHFKGRQSLLSFIQACPPLTITKEFEAQITPIIHLLSNAHRILYIGRDVLYPICLEGALKIKEIGYIAAEGIAAGEIKHGPMALVDEHTPIIILAPYSQGDIFAKIASNIQEVNARKGNLILITCQKGKTFFPQIKHTIVMPTTKEELLPILYSIPLQLLAYHYALNLGYNIDKPRNLAKSVTVE